jgi:tetrahydromethanopterin S-methyltransferase subunit G
MWARSDDYLDEITRRVDMIVQEVMGQTNKRIVKR